MTLKVCSTHDVLGGMTTKRKAGAVKVEPSKRLRKQSDLAAGFATQILRSPKKVKTLREARFEIDDAIEVSSEDDTPKPRFNSQLAREAAVKKEIQAPISPVRHIAVQTDNVVDSWLNYIPLRSVTDLAVHKKKVAAVQDWIIGAFKNVTERTVLVLTGPAGVGKTATVETLSHVLDFDIIEWQNPMAEVWSASFNRDAESLAQKFERFLSISDKYSTLDFGVARDPGDDRRKIIVVEDIPNTFSSNGVSAAKLAFQTSIKRYLASPRNKYPLILIVTETEPRGHEGDWKRSDGLSIRTLLSRDILESSNCTLMTFNDVAPTFISKALTRLVDSLPRSEALDISQAVLDEIATTANGDLRSAINTLQFISHRFRTHGRPAKSRRRKKRGEILTLTTDEASILNIITNREAALGYFHAIGKVVYNKREASESQIELPHHLAQEQRDRPESSVSAILDETSTDTLTFLSGIHQNYIPSTHNVTECAALMDALSAADVLRGTKIDGMVGVMGAMHALPQNAKRSHTVKLYFPAYKTLYVRESRVRDVLEEYQGSRSDQRLTGLPLLETLTYHHHITPSDAWSTAITFNKQLDENQDEEDTNHVKKREKQVPIVKDIILEDDDIEDF